MSSLRRRRQRCHANTAGKEDNSDDSADYFLDVVTEEEEKATAQVPPPSGIQIATPKQSRFDFLLSSYITFTQSPSNQDNVLNLFQYSLWLVSRFYSKTSQRGNNGLRELYSEISFVRYALRLFGLPVSIEAARSGSWGGGSRYNDKRIHLLGKILAWSMIIYYPLEHVAYVRWRAPKLFPRVNAGKYSAYSCRAWFVFIMGTITQCMLKLKELHKEREQLLLHNIKSDAAIRHNDDPKENSMVLAAVAEVDQSIEQERFNVLRNILFTLPSIHWSTYDTAPLLGDGVVNGLMWIESVVRMYQKIRLFRAS